MDLDIDRHYLPNRVRDCMLTCISARLFWQIVEAPGPMELERISYFYNLLRSEKCDFS